MLIAAWHQARGPAREDLIPGVQARTEPNGDWTLRVFAVTPLARGAAVLGLLCAGSGIMLGARRGQASLAEAALAWLAAVLIAAGMVAWTSWRLRQGLLDWRYVAARGELRPPGRASPLRKAQIGKLVVLKTERSDDGSAVCEPSAVAPLHGRHEHRERDFAHRVREAMRRSRRWCVPWKRLGLSAEGSRKPGRSAPALQPKLRSITAGNRGLPRVFRRSPRAWACSPRTICGPAASTSSRRRRGRAR